MSRLLILGVLVLSLLSCAYSAPNARATPVQVALYFESLCPYCRHFITTQLWPAYNSNLKDIFNVTLVPYGNAQENQTNSGKYSYTCQHGVLECQGNKIEGCAISVLKANQVMPYIFCLESSSQIEVSPYNAAVECCQQQGIPVDKIQSCYEGRLGNQLQHAMAVKTQALKPELDYVPWLTFDAVHDQNVNMEALNGFAKVVCELYKGVKPSECNK